MTDKELSDFLVDKAAAVVHLSHHAIMNPNRPNFPDDMRQAIANNAKFTLSCVVVWPGHAMNLPGSVGVIFKPSCENVVSVLNGDSGSTTLRDGSDSSLGHPLSEESLDATFNVAVGKYNEWRVHGAEVVGIFIANCSNIEVKKEVMLNTGGHEFKEVGAISITLGEVFAEFPDQSVFTMGSTGLIEIPRS